MATTGGVAAGDLAHLRRDAFSTVLTCVALALYLWCLALFQATERFVPLWRGPAILAAGLVLAWLLRERRPPLAAAALIAGLTAADLYVTALLGTHVAPYLLAVAVALSALFFGLEAVVAVTVANCALVIAVGRLALGLGPASPEVLAPVFVVGSVGILSALSVRNLYLALHWAWDRTVAANRHERELRERRAELVRTAKALDEACQRLEHMNYDLAQAREAAEEARLLKQQFTTNVSHELRTPLNVIAAFTEMMYFSPQSYGGVPLPPEYRGDVREVYRASQHLLRLIDDVLDLSQIEARRMKVHLEPVSLADVLAEAVEIMRPLLRGKEIALQVEVPADLPPALIDRARIRQVLLNLLNNARRFTDRGTISLRAEHTGRFIQVTVADTGIGVALADQDRVFDEFRQLDGTTTRRRGGTGLGLAISKRFVELHGGRIWVESEGVPGRGSRFHFTMLAAGATPVEAGTLLRTPGSAAPPGGRGRPLLLLDDDPAVAAMLERALEEYRVIPVDDAAQVPALASELHPRAIVLNPVQGPRAWRELRRLRHLPGVGGPAILCPLVGERRLAHELGAIDYLVKPITRSALAALLDRLGSDPGRILIVDDDPRMTRVLSRMIRSTGRDARVARAHSAAEALQKMRQQPPDLVLLDLIMPEIDGRRLLAQMREDAELRSIPVALITAQELTPDEERRLGGDVLMLANGAGLTNDEALRYLRALLEASGPPSSPPPEASPERAETRSA